MYTNQLIIETNLRAAKFAAKKLAELYTDVNKFSLFFSSKTRETYNLRFGYYQAICERLLAENERLLADEALKRKGNNV